VPVLVSAFNQGVAIPHDEVDFTVTAAVVLLHQAQSLLLEIA
jgi:hypothetical protein